MADTKNLSFFSLIILESISKMDEYIQIHSPKLKLFCINDNENTFQENRDTLKIYLEYLFPERAPWEK
ncbi:hypothetical protein IJ182_04795 [bacterium]|nr:hypothetical protein [bacterium]